MLRAFDVGAVVGGVAGASQHRADARQQLARVEGFRHVIVGAELQADDPVGLLAHRGQHHDRHLGLAAQPAGEVEATLARQHQVEHDEMVVAIGEGAAGFPGVAHRGHPHVVLLLQEAGEQIADLAVVVDHQDMGCMFHDS